VPDGPGGKKTHPHTHTHTQKASSTKVSMFFGVYSVGQAVGTDATWTLGHLQWRSATFTLRSVTGEQSSRLCDGWNGETDRQCHTHGQHGHIIYSIVCVCVCMYVRKYICTKVRTYVCITYVRTHACVYVCMYVCMYVWCYSETLRAGRSRDRILVRGENFRTVHTDHRAHPDSCTMCAGLLMGVKPPKCSADHGLLAPRLRMGGSIFLSPRWACPGISWSGLYLDPTL